MRLFVACELDTAIRNRLLDVTESARSGIDGVTWAAHENIHITLKFLGEVEDTRVDDITHALDTALSDKPGFPMSIRGLGAFPPHSTPHVVWAGVAEGRDDLVALNEVVEQALEPVGFERDRRHFSPHATVGRTKKQSRPRGLEDLIDREKTTDFGSQHSQKITLMRSELTSTGPIYTPVHTWNLRRD